MRIGKVYTINCNLDKMKCELCGKIKAGCFEANDAPGKFLCDKCVIKNIEKKGSRQELYLDRMMAGMEVKS